MCEISSKSARSRSRLRVSILDRPVVVFGATYAELAFAGSDHDRE